MERDGDGENLIFRAWWRPSAVVVGAGCAGVGSGGGVGGVLRLQPYELARLQGCKYSDNQRVSFYLFYVGLILLL